MKKNFLLKTEVCENSLALFYLGQMGFVIKYNDKYVLIDGYLSDYVDKNCCTENVKWKRNYPVPISPCELDFIDYVFCTHEHYDHADPITLSTIAKNNKKAIFFVPAPIKSTIMSYGIEEERIVSMICEKEISLDKSIFVMSIPAAHEELHADENGNFYEVGFKFRFGDILLFHGGDCCPYDGFAEKAGKSDIMILPVNGRDYYRTHVYDIIGCFDSTEAVTLSKQCGADLLIPSHFGLYDVNTINPAEFVDKLYKTNPKQKFHVFTPGERYIYQK